MRRSPDGISSINEPADISEFLVVRTESLLSGQTEEVVLPIPLSMYFKILSVLFNAPAIPGSTGHHEFSIFDKIISGSRFQLLSLAVTGLTTLNFNNVPVVAGGIIERRPATDEAMRLQIDNLYMGSHSTKTLTLRYHNGTNMTQTGSRNFLVIFKRVLPISLVRALG